MAEPKRVKVQLQGTTGTGTAEGMFKKLFQPLPENKKLPPVWHFWHFVVASVPPLLMYIYLSRQEKELQFLGDQKRDLALSEEEFIMARHEAQSLAFRQQLSDLTSRIQSLEQLSSSSPESNSPLSESNSTLSRASPLMNPIQPSITEKRRLRQLQSQNRVQQDR